MENIDIQQLELYLRGEMAPDARAKLEAALQTDADLQGRLEALRALTQGIKHAARADIRHRVEAVRDQIKWEEAQTPPPSAAPKASSGIWGYLLILFIGLSLGLGLGRLLFRPSTPPPTPALPDTANLLPVAIPEEDPIATFRIPGPRPGTTLQVSVRHKPALDSAVAYARLYVLDPGGVGLCIYARRDDDFWRTPMELTQRGNWFYLKIGTDELRLKDNGAEQEGH